MYLPIVSIPCENVTVSNDEHPSNSPSATLVIPTILFTSSKKLTVVKLEQLLNAYLPIDVIVVGIVKFFISWF